MVLTIRSNFWLNWFLHGIITFFPTISIISLINPLSSFPFQNLHQFYASKLHALFIIIFDPTLMCFFSIHHHLLFSLTFMWFDRFLVVYIFIHVYHYFHQVFFIYRGKKIFSYLMNS